MKKLIILVLLFVGCVDFVFSKPNLILQNQQSDLYPPKTIVIKHPAAADVNRYFAEVTVLRIEIYKVGSNEDLNTIIEALKKDKAVESISIDQLNGDFQALTISLKKGQGKQWFISWFKSAGLATIKINNDPVKKLDLL